MLRPRNLIPALALSLTTLACAQQGEREHVPVITVTGSATLDAPADEVYISVAVVSEGEQPQRVINENSQRVSRVLDALLNEGLEEGEVQTGRFTIQPIFTNPARGDPGGRRQISGYRVQNSLIVETPKLRLAGDLVQAAVDAGANQVDTVSFRLGDPRASRAEVLELAVSYARADAEAVARASGVHLGRIHSMVIGHAFDGPRPMMMGAEMARGGAASPPMAPGEVQVSATVTIEYEIEQ